MRQKEKKKLTGKNKQKHFSAEENIPWEGSKWMLKYGG